MDDKDVGKNEGLDLGDRPEELSIGGWSDSVIDWLGKHWRSGVVMLLVACLACGAGIASTYLWMRGQRQHQPRIEATLYETKDTYWSSGGQRVSIGIRVRNSGSETVTVVRTSLSRPGFKIVSGEPERSQVLASNSVTELAYTLSPDCDVPEVQGPTKLRLLVRAPGQKEQWIVVSIPQPASNAAGNTFAAWHFQSCFQIGAVQLTTLQASTSDGVLTLRVRLTAQPFFGTRPPQPVRLLKLAAEQDPSLIQASFTASGSGRSKPTDLPATGTLRIKVTGGQCTPLAWPMALSASVATSTGTSGQTDVAYDPPAAAQVLDFTTKQCG